MYPRIVAHWEAKSHALLAFLRHPKPIRRCFYTTNQLECLSREVKRRTKVVDSLGRRRWRSSCTWC
ncbi:MAG: transposase [Candidatus Hadarchaeum sp.]|uniref:transposase n=1 Tax=Candidatus Hadarchaeum sp. TaxID=2883567 RepID=UPI003D145865